MTPNILVREYRLISASFAALLFCVSIAEAQVQVPTQVPATVTVVEPLNSSVAQSAGPKAEKSPTMKKIEKKYKQWSQKVLDTAMRLDAFFGEDRAEDEVSKTWVRVRTDVKYVSGDGFEVKPRIRAKVVLPNLEKKLQLIFSSDEEDEKEGENARNHVGEEESRASAALRYLFRDSKDYKLDVDAGIRTKSGGIRTFGRVRFRKNFSLGNNVNGRFTNRLYWYTDTGWEDEVRLDYEKELNDRWFARSTSKLGWFEEKEGYFGEQTFSILHEISSKKTLAFDSITYLKSEPKQDEEYFNETLIQARYRQNYLWDWFFIEARPILAFPSNKDYDPEWRALIRGEVVFGGFKKF